MIVKDIYKNDVSTLYHFLLNLLEEHSSDEIFSESYATVAAHIHMDSEIQSSSLSLFFVPWFPPSHSNSQK